ncbi:MAG TPA: hypothetical protein VNU68_09130, partial [Verrucomicrobiae bacterium]|nr:hypothetical protein [Verrucomicrobiae bacterium]
LYSPTGVLLREQAAAVAAEASFRATNSGTFLVVVGDGNNSFVGSGPYRLTLAKTGSPVQVSDGDEGGPLTNGIMHMGFVDVGDLDLWSFTANAGESFVVRAGETNSGSSFAPALRLFSPDGVFLDVSATASGAEVSFRATNSGTFLVVVGDGNNGFVGSGSYRLTLAKTGSPVEVSPGDQGGPLTNGIMHTGSIEVGDLDVWTLTANAGENLIVRVGEVVAGSALAPWVRLFDPNGVLLSEQASPIAAEASFRATNSGTFLVVVGDGNNGLRGTGSYRLTLARTGAAIAVSAGDESGLLSPGVRDGTIDLGDLDIYSFTACVGDPIALTVTELEAGSSFAPWVRLYGRDGMLLNSVAQPATAQISRPAPATGTYTIVIGDGNNGLAGAGGYRLSTLELSAGLKLCRPTKLGGGNLLYGGVGGPPSATFVVISATNITTPFPLWVPILTNQFGAFGEFSFTNRITPGVPDQFFRLCVP